MATIAPPSDFDTPIDAAAKAKRDIFCPYIPALQFLAGFDSSKVQETSAVASYSPFDAPNVEMSFDSSFAAAMESMSKTVGSDNEHSHLTAGGGIGIGCPCLGASVSVHYDKDVTTTDDTMLYSLKKLCTAGIFTFKQPPKLSDTALGVLKGDNGVQRFKELYGDYFVAGYLIGEEMGLRFSKEVKSETDVETISVTVEVHILFCTISHTFSHTNITSFASTACSLTTFSTIDATYTPRIEINPSSADPLDENAVETAVDANKVELMALRAAAFEDQASTVEVRLRERIASLNMAMDIVASRGGQSGMSREEIEDVARSGWAQSVWLVRYENLQEWQIAANEGAVKAMASPALSTDGSRDMAGHADNKEN